MEDYILFTGKIDGVYREVQIYPVLSSPDQYLVHWDGFEIGLIMKMDDKWYTNSLPLISVTNEIGAHIDHKQIKSERILEIDGRSFTIKAAYEKQRYDVKCDGLKIGYVVAADNLDQDGNLVWLGSTSLLNLHAKTIGQYIIAKNL